MQDNTILTVLHSSGIHPVKASRDVFCLAKAISELAQSNVRRRSITIIVFVINCFLLVCDRDGIECYE